MSLDVTEISGYIDENAESLKAKAMLGEKTAKYVNVQTGVKGTTKIQLIETSATFAEGGAGFTPVAADKTNFSNRELIPGFVKVQESLDITELNDTYMKHQLGVGSYNTKVPFAEAYFTSKINSINRAVEKANWQGDTDSSNPNLNKYDGFIKIIDGEGDVVDGNTSEATEVSKENIVGLVDDMYGVLNIDALESDDLTLAMGYDFARMYVAKHKDLDLRNYGAMTGGDFEFTIPATNIKAFATTGLNGTGRMFLFEGNNLTLGVDGENDEEQFDFWYSNDNKEWRFHSTFKKACQVTYPERIVSFAVSTGV